MAETREIEIESAEHVSGTKRRQPVGAEPQADGVHFRVWAPRSRTAAVVAPVTGPNRAEAQIFPLAAEGNGYFSGAVAGMRPGTRYKIQLDSGDFPDPASRFQPEGPHGPSQVIDAKAFHWTDAPWKGASMEGQVLYEMHIGSFTKEGTWKAAARHLDYLAQLGVTVLEVMPVAEFPGRFGWGYDGVDLFAPTHLYGAPDDFREFVNQAHSAGLGVILDVVYNHLGPDGCYLREFSADYFSSKYENEWGEPLNFDGKNSGPVREFFIANAVHWIDEYHLDGLRFDATQQIFDRSAENIMAAITTQMRLAAKGREIYAVAENEPQDVQLIKPPAEGGFGMDALWNDDFHHSAMAALTGRTEAYYTDYRGTPQEFISMAKYGYLFQGQRYRWQKARRGTASLKTAPAHFVTFLQNHDQVANSLCGKRIHEIAAPGLLRAFTALVLLGPSTPMLFQGQEFAASAPFLYFADHVPKLAEEVAAGRRKFLEQFPSIAALGADAETLRGRPESEETFLRCKLDHSERGLHAEAIRLHADLLALRKSDAVFGHPRRGGIDGAVLAPHACVFRFFGERDDDRLLILNLGVEVRLDPAPEPLLAPVAGGAWETLWSSEDPAYGGEGTGPLETEENWLLPGHAAIALKPGKIEQ